MMTKQTKKPIGAVETVTMTSAELSPDELTQLATLYSQGHYAEAEAFDRSLILRFPTHGFAWKVLGAILQKLGRMDEALAAKKKAVELLPQDAETHSNLGNALLQEGLSIEAEACCRRALALNPGLIGAHTHLGLALQKQGRPADAEACFRTLLAINPGFAEAYYHLGNCIKEQGRLLEAEASYRQALDIRPDYVEAHYNLGAALNEQNRLSDAVTCFRRVLEIAPNFANTHSNLATILEKLGQLSEAELCYRRVLEVTPDSPNIYSNIGGILKNQGRLPEAKDAYQKALLLAPDHGYALGQYAHVQRHLCDWSAMHQDDAKLLAFIGQQASATIPFGMLSMALFTPDDLRRATKAHAEFRYRAKIDAEPYSKGASRRHRPLRIGYLSADLYSHATVHLLAGVLEKRNPQDFASYVYSYGPDKKDVGRSRMEAACECFREVRTLSDEAVAQQILTDEIDILVDLKGYTQDSRLGISALRPAPVIVSWLGYPGTLGHPRLADYIIGDPVVTPLAHAGHFSETLALMPHCYQPNDNRRSIGTCPSREAVGLPATGLVFCSFNQSYKITPDMFALWCRLLDAVPDSVLWLLAPTPEAQANLRREAQQRGIGQARLVFAPAMQQTEHLGRLQLADLALDTFPYTSHTTASDALWVGVPLATKSGETFASRVAASILQALGLPELVATTDEDYFELVRSLALDTERLAQVKQTIAERRLTSPLFDTQRFARDLERLYRAIWAQELKGERKPVVLAVEEWIAADLTNASKIIAVGGLGDNLRLPFSACPLCENKQADPVKTVDVRSHGLYTELLPSDLTWLQCQRCRHVYTQHYWTEQGLAQVFANAHAMQVAGGNPDLKRQLWKTVVHNALTVLGGYRVLQTHLPAPAWLDVGCGDGALVMTAAEFGFNALGMDARQQTVQAIQSYGYQAVCGDFMTTRIVEGPLVISMMDVLEHLPYPGAALQRAHSLLHHQGVLVISLPNSDCLSWRLMDQMQANPYWIEIEHYHNFSRQRLAALLSQYGFEVVHYDIPDRYKATMELYAVKKQ